MRKVTAGNIATWINQLPRNRAYNYINPNNHSLIEIVSVALPEGPIQIKRWNPSKMESSASARIQSISTEMLWRIANALQPGRPINVDRVLGASYNTRSVLESLLACTPEMYFCYPGRIMEFAGRTTVEHGHKHLIWLPDQPHENGIQSETSIEVAISEIPTSEVIYEVVSLPETYDYGGLDIESARRHTQIQIALYLIGLELGYRTWIAQNDKGIRYKDKPLLEYPNVIGNLRNEGMVQVFDGAVEAGLFIDCIWFKNGRLMPAVMEVEHTTGVTSGLERMLNFYNKLPAIKTRYAVVAPDEDRSKVLSEAQKEAFAPLDPWFFPYSSVEELFAISQRHSLHGVTDEFLDGFMEKCIV